MLNNLSAAGFKLVGSWVIDGMSMAFNPTEDISEREAVYVFVDGESPIYVGLTMMPLAKRLYFYANPGPTQSTNIRIKALILERLLGGADISVFAAWPGTTEWNGLPVNLAPGLESALIHLFAPEWNKRGTKKSSPSKRLKSAAASVRGDLVTNENHAFWVYINDTRKRGAIHIATCSFCNFGKGTHGGGATKSGYWRSFETREKAQTFAHSTGYSDVNLCRVCGAD